MQITQRANTEVKNEALAAAQRKIRERGIYPTDKFSQIFSQVQRNFSSPLFFVAFITWPFLSTGVSLVSTQPPEHSDIDPAVEQEQPGAPSPAPAAAQQEPQTPTQGTTAAL